MFCCCRSVLGLGILLLSTGFVIGAQVFQFGVGLLAAESSRSVVVERRVRCIGSGVVWRSVNCDLRRDLGVWCEIVELVEGREEEVRVWGLEDDAESAGRKWRRARR